jgi:hypothetical protein
MSDCTCDRDTLINDPGMSAPRCPVHDPKPQAVTPYVKGHGTVINWDTLSPADPIGDLRRAYGGEQIVTNQADDPFDADKIREHMEGGDD